MSMQRASFTNPGLTAELETPDIDLSALTVPELRFWYHMYGGSTGDLQVDIYDGTNWNTNVDLISGEQGNQWFERIVNLAAYAGQTIRVRFVSSTGTTPTQFGDIAIDDFQIDEGAELSGSFGLTAQCGQHVHSIGLDERRRFELRRSNMVRQDSP